MFFVWSLFLLFFLFSFLNENMNSWTCFSLFMRVWEVRLRNGWFIPVQFLNVFTSQGNADNQSTSITSYFSSTTVQTFVGICKIETISRFFWSSLVGSWASLAMFKVIFQGLLPPQEPSSFQELLGVIEERSALANVLRSIRPARDAEMHRWPSFQKYISVLEQDPWQAPVVLSIQRLQWFFSPAPTYLHIKLITHLFVSRFWWPAHWVHHT